jgi:hypothetical protein
MAALLLEAVPLAFEGLELLGGVIAGAVEGATSSAAVGQTASGLAIGAATQQIDLGLKDAAKGAMNTIFGEDTTEKISETLSQAKSFHEELQAQTTFQGTSKMFPGIGGVVSVHSRSSEPKRPQPRYRETVNIQDEDYSRDVQNLDGMGLITHRTGINMSSDETIPHEISESTNVNKIPQQDTIAPQTAHIDEVILKDNRVTNPYKRGLDLGGFVAIMTNQAVSVRSNRLNNKTEDELLKELSTQRPGLNYLIKPFIEHSSNITQPEGDEYDEIARVYNGKGLDVSQVRGYMNDEGFMNFEIVDEAGELQTWVGNNSYTRVPTIHGVWVGINSRNDDYPVDLMDLFAMLHDISYQRDGSFNKRGDYQLISRIAQNFQRIPLNARPAAKAALGWFNYGGHALRSMTGASHDLQILDNDRGEGDDSIFPLIVPEAEQQENYLELRDLFFDGVVEGFESESIHSSMWSMYNQAPNPLILQEIDDLEITLL